MIPYLLILVPTTAWATGNLLFGLVWARGVFAHAPRQMEAIGPGQISRDLAGQIFGDALTVWYCAPLAILALLTCIGLGWWAGRVLKAGRRMTSAALSAGFLMLGVLHTQTTAAVQEVGLLAAQLRTGTGSNPDAQRLVFQSRHAQSERLVKLETVVVLLLAIAAAAALVHTSRASPSRVQA